MRNTNAPLHSSIHSHHNQLNWIFAFKNTTKLSLAAVIFVYQVLQVVQVNDLKPYFFPFLSSTVTSLHNRQKLDVGESCKVDTTNMFKIESKQSFGRLNAPQWVGRVKYALFATAFSHS